MPISWVIGIRIDLRTGTIRQESLASGNFEFPVLNPLQSCHRHRFGYMTAIIGDSPFFTAVSRVDNAAGGRESYGFGLHRYCSEPIFAPRPGSSYASIPDAEPGWLLTEVYDGDSYKSFLAVLATEYLVRGPIATVRLEYRVPIGFSGFWQGAPRDPQGVVGTGHDRGRG